MNKESKDYIAAVNWPKVKAYCCREWIIFAGLPCGKCGDCNEKPQVRFGEQPFI